MSECLCWTTVYLCFGTECDSDENIMTQISSWFSGCHRRLGTGGKTQDRVNNTQSLIASIWNGRPLLPCRC
ncbi:hypothetical protein SODALDRAFT_131545 [Sodiomyces alkalinus F11]|uniref:Uncharacterized protein n=1 Tax=Sodiomyces alkalinus (strain CBS 110278 / VKM F-3762 / F11) TaxID=1314773 RepID=A0A3N2PYF0_SODAK|nr:hypothetical protein SODALDRAFT_131545 [Sodiomyces alkalinus F11]ROT39514.1 hypothetical protein SODALDRAFT_131545 [Sodiomyces alkalinus F11]